MKADNLLLALAGAGLLFLALRSRASETETEPYGPPLPPGYGPGYVPPKKLEFPDISELFGGGKTGFPSISDIFGGGQSSPTPRPPLVTPPYFPNQYQGGTMTAPIVPSVWVPPPNPYTALIAETERRNGIPRNLLARLLWQESRFNPTAKSPVGAQGIAQVMPQTAAGPGYGVPPLRDPWNPQEAIPWAGQYLAALYRSFGNWRYALAAYNWGAGNVQRVLRSHGPGWLNASPTETQNYVAQITRDVPVA